jgi:(1->4)-alpha-D-glucan 1-alpha-D-glucosylmutase
MAAHPQGPVPLKPIRWPLPKRKAHSERASETPAATYRLQFRPDFGFAAARRLVPFLERIGISHVYASPVFEARHGSTHGYDITDPTRLREELGGEEDFESFTNELGRSGIGLILDIVPNHMSATAENPWWADVLEDGRNSQFASFFDIDWDADPAGKLIVPVLGDECADIVGRGELRVALDEQGLCLRYWEHRFPLSLESYGELLGTPGVPPLPASGRVRRAYKDALKADIWRAFSDRASFRAADVARLLGKQHYRLAYWRTGRHKVNYRRFFDVNELVALRAEDDDVFRATHSLLFRLVEEGKVQGVRIDHIDGLHNPAAYIARLAESLRHASAGRAPYIVVEKILLRGERLRHDWQVAGSTGYDFLDRANRLFVNHANMPAIEAAYAEFTGCAASYSEVVYRQKKRVLRDLFSGELCRMADSVCQLADSRGVELIRAHVAAAIEEVTAALPVYRTYVRGFASSGADRRIIEHAFRLAQSRIAADVQPALSFLHGLFLPHGPLSRGLAEPLPTLRLLMQWQQLTGPVMAKGMEDTACYVHNALVSLNVVGGNRDALTVDDFHYFNEHRQSRWPSSLNATSTHDTKRSEDVRCRINVLSEIPGQWKRWLDRWSAWNRPKKQMVDGEPAPCAADEALLYQVLLGAWPLLKEREAAFARRVRDFMIKAAREAKTHTSWCDPNGAYEQALARFVASIMTAAPGDRFLDDLRCAVGRIAPFGAAASLAQTLLKIAGPGVPDFYQGCVLWDFSLVDPDNRRPVDFDARIDHLGELERAECDGTLSLAAALRSSWRDGRIKMYTMRRALNFRREHPQTFRRGDYIPLRTTGARGDHVVAFARRRGADWAVVIVPRLLASLDIEQDPLRPRSLAGIEVELPDSAPRRWVNVFTGETQQGPRIDVSRALADFPVALLSGSAGLRRVRGDGGVVSIRPAL